MKIIDLDDKKTKNSQETILALGNFDGLHLGHKELISNMVTIAHKKNLKSAVLLFKDHSGKVLYPSSKKFVMTTLKDKISLLENKGVDIVFTKEFDLEFSKTTPHEFISFIISQTKCKGVVVGKDYTFGHKGRGNTEFLIEHFIHNEFQLFEIDNYCLNNQLVKSTLIRNFLQRGDIKSANKYLGRTYSIEGTIIHGEDRGHLLGFPTANLENSYYILPKEGVYFTISLIKEDLFLSMTAIGENKTFHETEKKIETYLLNFSGNIYGQTQRIYFIEYMRDNDLYPSVEELIKQLHKDKDYISNKDLQVYRNMLI